MGLLNRLGRGALSAGRFASDDLPMPLLGAGAGALGGIGHAAATGDANPLDNALAGAAIGGGLGMGQLAARGAQGFARGFARTAPEQLQALKQQALQYVRDPGMQQRVIAAQTAEEVELILQTAVSQARSRLTEGGF